MKMIIWVRLVCLLVALLGFAARFVAVLRWGLIGSCRWGRKLCEIWLELWCMVTGALAACPEGAGSLPTPSVSTGGFNRGSAWRRRGSVRILYWVPDLYFPCPFWWAEIELLEDPWLPDVEGNLQGHVGPVSPVSKMEMFAIFWTGGTVGLWGDQTDRVWCSKRLCEKPQLWEVERCLVKWLGWC